jgi:hypothetical protein
MGRFELILFADSTPGASPAHNALGIAVWVGLGILTISMLVLMRTRWGQAQSLSKCVVLSVFAHVLFFAYAYGTRLIFDSSPTQQEESIRIALVKHNHRETEHSTEQDSWNRFASDFSISPDVASPTMQESEVDDIDTPQPVAPRPEFAVAASESPIEAATDGGSFPELPLPESEAIQPVAPSEIAVEPPPPQPRPQEPPLVPARESPERLPVETIPGRSKNETAEPKAFNQAPNSATLQRLVDVEMNSQLADALPANSDSVEAANNRKNLPEYDGGDVGASSNSIAPSAPGNQNDTPARRLGDGELLPEVYRSRIARNRLGLIKQQGGSEQTEEAVEAALAWLAENQAADGRWDADRFGAGQETRVLGHDRRGSGINADTGISGLALLAFLSAGHTHFEGDYRRTVQRGLEFLLGQQASNGSMAGNAKMYARMYCHGMATLAISEAFAMTGDRRMRPYVERAVQFTIDAQHPETGGWRYQPADRNDLSHDRGDMSQFGWQVMALKSAELAGITIPGETRAGMLRFLRSVSKGEHRGLASYRPTERPSETMTAEALACRYFLGIPRSNATVGEATRYLLRKPPTNGKANLYYWYYGTLALHQTQGDDWTRWNQAAQQQLLDRQRSDGAMAGSWDPDTVWGSYGGRVFTTALGTLCLEVYYRYLPIYE